MRKLLFLGFAAALFSPGSGLAQTIRAVPGAEGTAPVPVLARASGLSSRLEAEIDAVQPDLLPVYQWFHQNPELSGAEEQTSRKLAGYLKDLGMEVSEGIGGHGVAGILRGGSEGPTVLLRAEMDALPIQEETGLPYASSKPGVMHACGHDMHMSAALGALRALARLKDLWRGTVLFVGQPAEETGAGARGMAADDKFRAVLKKTGLPVAALAQHVSVNDPAGEVPIVAGPQSANINDVEIVVHGRGGHGARPQNAVDPVVMAAEMVMSFQSIVSRRIKPGVKALVTVGSIQAGSMPNIIPDEARLLVTVRSLDDEVQKRLVSEVKRTAEGVALAHGAPKPPDFPRNENDEVAAGYNDPRVVGRLKAAFERAFGSGAAPDYETGLGGEDFGYFGRLLKIPGAMWKLGSSDPEMLKAVPEESRPGLHSSKFAPWAKPTLRAGSLAAAAAVLEFLGL